MNDLDRPRRQRIVVDGMHLPEPSDARVLVWEDRRIVWVGTDPRQAPPVDETIALAGAWITPGFVDAHVHGTATGLKLDGVDLSSSMSADDVVDRVKAYAADRDDDPIVGSGWEEHGWPIAVPPSAEQLASAAPGRRVLLDRIDGHSCLVDPRTLALVDGHGDDIDRDDAGRPTGWLREAAAGRARTRIWDLLPDARRSRARQAAARHAAQVGITCMHEMGNRALSSLDDAVAWSTGDWPVEVLAWWADIDPSVALTHRLQPGGDLFLDGAIGSRTAAVSGGYRDGPDLGGLFFSDSEVVNFFVRCTRAGVGGGVHAIGDEAIEQAVAGVERAAAEVGRTAARDCRHRIEHVELPRAGHVQRMARLGIVASVQPAFDALWGGPSGLYASRFGRDAAVVSNPFSDFVAAGCSMAFGSDSTVTPMAPWAGVLAATAHRGGYSISRRTALTAATLGGRHVARQEGVGPLRPGYRADLAVWDGDPMAGALDTPPRCLMTMVGGFVTSSSTEYS
ncbi:MAG TPA: amidohydrolase family protein [Euzebyales bacterium]|nr:amidohydrolase family protein [Euzebyales bacterium]